MRENERQNICSVFTTSRFLNSVRHYSTVSDRTCFYIELR